jgi:putative oxidoreductase
MAAMQPGPNTERLAFGNYAREHGVARPRRVARGSVGYSRADSDIDGSAYARTYERTHAPRLSPAVALTGRLLMAAIFAVSGITKLLHPETAAAAMLGEGIPSADTLVWVAGIAEVLGAASLLFGVLTRAGAIGLALFLVPTTFYFHDFWNFDGPAALAQQVNFLKNLAIIGGLLLLAVHGPGRYSIDHALHRHRVQD